MNWLLRTQFEIFREVEFVILNQMIKTEIIYCAVMHETIFPVVIGEGKHPFPFRIRKLSPLPAMVLYEQSYGRVASCRDYYL